MTSHLRVTIDDIDLVLTEDTSISIELKNPYLNDGIDTYTYSFDVPLDGNRELLGDLDNPDSDRRLTSIEGHPMAIYIDGVLFAHGKVATIEEQTIVDKVSISMTSNKKQLKDMIGDLKLRDLQFPESDREDLKIGEKIGNITIVGESHYQVKAVFTVKDYNSKAYDYFKRLDAYSEDATTRKLDTKRIQPQALGFSCNKEYYPDTSKDLTGKVKVKVGADGKKQIKQDYINTTVPFNDTITHNDGTERRALYHNARICYLQHGIDADGKSSSETLIQGQYGPYFVLPADRPQSGICFYVLYVLEVLFKQLGIIYGKEQYDEIAKVQDLNRLSFFTTRCKYDVSPKYFFNNMTNLDGSDDDFTKKENFDDNRVNEWLSERDCKGEIKASMTPNGEEVYTAVYGQKYIVYPNIYAYSFDDRSKYMSDSRYVFLGSHSGYRLDYYALKSEGYERQVNYVDGSETIKLDIHLPDGTVFKDVVLGCIGTMYSGGGSEVEEPFKYGASVMNMYANSQNLPDMNATALLDSLWGSFGLRFRYDTESNIVEPYYIKDVLSTQTVHTIYGSDISVHPVSERITGVTVKYSSEKERTEQLADVYNSVTNYDTSFDYLVDKTDVGKINVSQDFNQLSHGIISAGDETLYIDMNTGNAFRIKINKEELDNSNINALQPALFRVAQWKGLTVYGDAFADLPEEEKQNSEVRDSIIEISSDFIPLDQNDLYAKKQKQEALLCPFTDDEMWSNAAEMPAIQAVVDSTVAFVHTVDFYVKTEERYDPTGTDDGNSPLQEKDWATAITLMRGGGADADINHYDSGYDFFNNEKWRMVAGTITCDSDSLSLYKMVYDYNGKEGGVGLPMPEDRVSLCIRAYHTAPADIPNTNIRNGDILCKDMSVARRGLADKFFSEYIYFLLHRKKLAIKTMCEIEHIIDMQWKDRYCIAGHTGWIDQLSVKVSVQKGIEKVEFTMFEL